MAYSVAYTPTGKTSVHTRFDDDGRKHWTI